MGDLVQDFRYSLRMLARNPAFAAVAVLTLALGIGANTAMFTVVNAVLLRPLPFPDSSRLVEIHWLSPQGQPLDLTIPQLKFLEEHARAFDSIAGLRGFWDAHFKFGASQGWARLKPVTAGFIRTLGVHPVLGRDFLPEEDRPGEPRALILTDDLWRTAFSADPSIIGKQVASDDESYIVVGVLPAGFKFVERVDGFVTMQPGDSIADKGFNTEVLGRLKPGVSYSKAQADLDAAHRAYLDAKMGDASERGIGLIGYREWLAGDIRPSLLILFSAVASLLLIACASLGGLILARVTARQRETSIRLALGAPRGRLFSLFFSESLLVSFAGAGGGWLGAYWLLDGLSASIPFNLPSTARLHPDMHVLIFTLTLAISTSLLFSLAPLVRASRLDVNETLKTAGATSGEGREHVRTQRLLIVGEVAISVALLVGTGLMLESLYRMHQEKLGFDPDGLVALDTSVGPDHRKSGAARWDFERRVLERLQSLPGVSLVACTNKLPLTGQSNLPTEHLGKPEQSIGGMEYRAVTPEYFRALGIPVLRGRGILTSDTRDAPGVAVISESVAQEWFPSGNPIGERLQVGRYQGQEFKEVEEPPREIVGVVGDVKAYSVALPSPPTVYVPASQVGDGIAAGSGHTSWVIRAKTTSGLAPELRQVLAQVDSQERVLDVRSMKDIVQESVARPRFDSALMSAFAGLAVTLAGIGIFGVLSYQVSRRVHEIGVRIALGAERADVLKLVVRQGMVLAATGIGIGLAGAWTLARFLSTILFGVQAHEPAVFLAAAFVMGTVAFLASYFPARRATKVDPLVALRYE